MNPYYNPTILKDQGSEMLDLISKLSSLLQSLPQSPSFSPGYFLDKFPSEPPLEGTSISSLIKHTEEDLFPGLTLHNSPLNFAMTGQVSETTLMAEIFSNAFHTPGFSWEASPSQTELENIVMDWFAEMIGLPEKFFIKGEGGGVLSTSTTTSYFHSINVAKYKKMEQLNIDFTDETTLKFVAYYPEINENKAKKALKLKEITHFRAVPMIFDEINLNYSVCTQELESLIVKDLSNGLIPFWCDSSLGSETLSSVDNLEEVLKICEKYGLSLNINATYAGSFLMLPSYREKYNKIFEKADFLLINARYLGTGGYSSLLYFSDKMLFRKSLGGLMGYPIVDIKLQKSNIMHLKDFSIGFGKRFNSFKLYLLIRRIGAGGIREMLQKRVQKAQILEDFLNKLNSSIEIKQKNRFGSLCFLVKNSDNEKFCDEINREENTGIIEKCYVGGKCILKISINNGEISEENIASLLEKIKNI